jgi:hypothetical protein
MKRSRRVFLAFAGTTVALPVLPRLALALDHPTRPVHLVFGFPTGLSPDILARLSEGPCRVVPGAHPLHFRFIVIFLHSIRPIALA